MQLTRREFAAATAGGLSLFSWPAVARAAAAEPVRHAHLELPAGPYTRTELSKLIACAAEAAGYAEPLAINALGVKVSSADYPATFALTIQFPEARVLNIRASQLHAGVPELTLRGQRTSTELRYSQVDGIFYRIA